MKYCTRCKRNLPDDNFYKLKTGKRQFSYCKECNSERSKIIYQNNKEYYSIKAKKQDIKYREEVRALLIKYKNVPCADCGNKYPIECMDFDHLPEFNKSFTISHSRKSIKLIEEEIKKCEVVCSNCHRIRTSKRRLK
jgi:hypothetical protein